MQSPKSKNQNDMVNLPLVLGAAGRGTRMKNLSQNRPKHLVEVYGRPFLDYVLDSVVMAGFTNITMVIGYQADKMISFLSRRKEKINIVNQTKMVGDKLGTAAVVEAVEKFLSPNSFVFFNADSLYTNEIYKNLITDDGYNHMICGYHDDPTEYGVVEVEKGFLKRIVEKPKEPVCNIINLGAYLLQPEIFSLVHTLRPSSRGEYEIVDALNILGQKKQVKVNQFDGEWVDFGKPEDLPKVEKFVRKYFLQ